MRFELDDKSVDELLLDPNNYRFLDLPSWRRRQRQRFHDPSVQEATLRLFESTPSYNLTELRESILANGYVRLERLVVIPYEHAQGYYLVIEGNRRVAALRTMLRDNNQAVLTLTADQVTDFTTIPVAILDAGEEGIIAAERVLMGIRHIAGPQEWGAYQQAYLISQLVDEEGQQFDDIAKHLGLSATETRRRYRAIRALQSMENDEMYANVAKPQFYRFFHELVSLPVVREFFSWDHDATVFQDPDRTRQFYEMIEPLESGFTPKLRTYLDVRQLRVIIGNPAAEAALLDPDQSLASAIARAQPDESMQLTSDLMSEARRFHRVLGTVQIEAVSGLSAEDIQFLEELENMISSRLDQHRRLVG